jgi:hypothetical protein
MPVPNREGAVVAEQAAEEAFQLAIHEAELRYQECRETLMASMMATRRGRCLAAINNLRQFPPPR